MSLKYHISKGLEDTVPKLWLSWNILRRNRNFSADYWVLPQLCRKNAVSVDIGGNRGWYAYYMAWLSREVHVFEPNPICLAQLAGYKTKNMTVHEFALSDQVGTTKMRFDPDNTGIGTIEQTNSLTNNPGIRRLIEIDVPLKTVDSFCFSNVGFMKIDVEGHEPAVLRGAQMLLTASRPALLIELEVRHNPRVFEEVWSVLDPLKYRMYYCADARLRPVNRAKIENMQKGPPESDPDYIYNFVFLPDRPPDVAS